MSISNYDDMIDSRDVIERIEELETNIEIDEEDGVNPAEYADDAEELATLQALADEASISPDWTYGETLIRDSYFEEYAQQLAEDYDMIQEGIQWPARCIDWEQAARELQMDYRRVDFDGVDYWIRA